MTREEREALEQRICNLYYDSDKSLKTTVNYFKKQNIPKYNILYIKKVFTISNHQGFVTK